MTQLSGGPGKQRRLDRRDPEGGRRVRPAVDEVADAGRRPAAGRWGLAGRSRGTRRSRVCAERAAGRCRTRCRTVPGGCGIRCRRRHRRRPPASASSSRVTKVARRRSIIGSSPRVAPGHACRSGPRGARPCSGQANRSRHRPLAPHPVPDPRLAQLDDDVGDESGRRCPGRADARRRDERAATDRGGHGSRSAILQPQRGHRRRHRCVAAVRLVWPASHSGVGPRPRLVRPPA